MKLTIMLFARVESMLKCFRGFETGLQKILKLKKMMVMCENFLRLHLLFCDRLRLPKNTIGAAFRCMLIINILPAYLSANDKELKYDWDKLRKEHWAFSPPEKVEVPETESHFPNPIDAFVIKKLDEAGIVQSPLAPPEVLIRRIYQSLTGLEPTYKDVQKFLSDEDPAKYEKLVDQLLSSPRYGEKWGRNWLDVARYSDGTGYTLPGESGLLPYSWTYRDYVIRSFNEDKPFNEFIKQQLAADLMHLKDKRDLAALGFIRLGQDYRDMKERPHEMVDVATQAFLGLTVSCARCHDHKFDPIPTADYYSLFGVFKSIQEPPMEDYPIIYESTDPEQKKAFEVEFARHTRAMMDFKKEAAEKLLKIFYKSLPDYFKQAAFTHLKLKPAIRTNRGMSDAFLHYLKNKKEAGQSPFFSLWNQVIQDPANSKKYVKKALSSESTPQILKEELLKLEKQGRNDVLMAYISVAEKLKNKNLNVTQGYTEHFTGIVLREKNLLRFVNSGIAGLKPKYLKLAGNLKKAWNHPGGPAKAMIVREKSRPYDPYIFIRGQRDVRGPSVPRRYLQILSKDDGIFRKGSGRLEFAERVASNDNPLTARVIVNRIWAWNFGKGLVRTPSNFGVLAEKPSHPELLDFLTNWFIENGWSIKKLQKLITTSQTFMQSSEYRKQAASIDGNNLLLWRIDPVRKSWEQVRDSVIQVSGVLENRNGGVPVSLLTSKEANVRTVYGLLNRRNLPGPFKYFDFPSTTVSCEARTNTISPQQGLFLMNSAFSARYAQKIAENLGGKTDSEKIDSIYKKVLNRLPAKDEKKSVQKFINETRELYKNIYSRWEYGYAQLEKNSIKNFKPFKVFKEGRWQASEKYPDPQAGYAYLSAEGGHPGKGENSAVVRRCNFYSEGTVKITGKMIHLNKKDGDGVRVLILHNGQLLGQWKSKGNSVPTDSGEIAVKAGDRIDLVVEPGKNPAADRFEWPMEMTMNMQGAVDTWSVFDIFSNEQKSGITYSVWSCLAQTLIMSNEFIYVD